MTISTRFIRRIQHLGAVLVFGLASAAAAVAQPPASLFSGGVRQVAPWEYGAAQRGQIDLAQQTLDKDWALAPQFGNAFLHLRVPFSSQVIVRRPNAVPIIVRSGGGSRDLQLTSVPPHESTATVEVRMHDEDCLKQDNSPFVSCTKQVTLWPGRRAYLTFVNEEFKKEHDAERTQLIAFESGGNEPGNLSSEAPLPELGPQEAAPPSVRREVLPVPVRRAVAGMPAVILEPDVAPATSTVIDYQFSLSGDSAKLTLDLDDGNSSNLNLATTLIKAMLESVVLHVDAGAPDHDRNWEIVDTFRLHLHLHAFTESGAEANLWLIPQSETLTLKASENATKIRLNLMDSYQKHEGLEFFAKVQGFVAQNGVATIGFHAYVSRVHVILGPDGAAAHEIVLQRYKINDPLNLFTVTLVK